MDNKPLLSICIPTYNRGYILKLVLDKYIHNSEFNEEVELIISDNCSDDDTYEICQYFGNLHKNIRYYRNDENIHDKNFVRVLNYGRGDYLKLTNDCEYMNAENLALMKSVLRKHLQEKIPVFFTNDFLFTRKRAEVVHCNNIDDYVAVVSTYVTSNNVFGAWREHWNQIEDKTRYAHLKLQQVDWSYQIVSKIGGCMVYNMKVLISSPVKRRIRTGYNWFGVHLHNYYQIMNPYIEKGSIKPKTFLEDKHYLLEHFKPELCYIYIYNYTKTWRFDTEGTTELLKRYYKGDPYLIYVFCKLPVYYIYMLVKAIYLYLKLKIDNR